MSDHFNSFLMNDVLIRRRGEIHVDAAWSVDYLPGRVGGAVYLHRDALERHDADLLGTVCSFGSAAGARFRWNVCKLSPHRHRVSLLHYPRFRDDAHPVLAAAASFDLNDGTARDNAVRTARLPLPPRLYK